MKKKKNMKGKSSKNISFLEDFGKTLKIEINQLKAEFLETILEKPISIILLKNIYSFLHKNKDEILTSEILTKEELEIFKEFIKNYDGIIQQL